MAEALPKSTRWCCESTCLINVDQCSVKPPVTGRFLDTGSSYVVGFIAPSFVYLANTQSLCIDPPPSHSFLQRLSSLVASLSSPHSSTTSLLSNGLNSFDRQSTAVCALGSALKLHLFVQYTLSALKSVSIAIQPRSITFVFNITEQQRATIM